MQNFVIIGAVVILIIVGFVVATGSNETTPVAVPSNEAAPMNDEAVNTEMESETGVMVGGDVMLPSLDIVDNALRASTLSTLVAAVTAAELVDTLKGPGPFTVFAPTNAAFLALPAGTVETLLLPENKADLQGILTYHVVAGNFTAAELTNGMTLTTVNGAVLTITIEGGVVLVNGSAVVETADVISSNGVTHVISAVLLPPAAI